MMIENAERFGLAQLHQLRGRVGRGDAQSYCIMVNASDSKNSMKRLDILNKSNDGFKIASEDLKLRGPGDFFGIRQSGEMQFYWRISIRMRLYYSRHLRRCRICLRQTRNYARKKI